MYRESRHWVHNLFKVGAGGRLGWYLDTVIMILILGNVVAVILETVDPLYTAYGYEFYLFEIVSVAVFSTEYIGRLWAATEHPEYSDPVRGRLRFALSPYMLIDMLAIVPFFLGFLVDLRFLRAIRLLRFLRLFKLARYTESITLFATVLRKKKADLVVTSTIGAILLLLASSLMYFAERAAQPEAFSSIPEALWWGVVTLTTVGYGDVHPVTTLGKVIGAAVAVIGIGLFALPASILASGFMEVAIEDREYSCPHCGELVSEDDLLDHE
ncbi:ion transporter [Haloferacaceae archaeon DSL9]